MSEGDIAGAERFFAIMGEHTPREAIRGSVTAAAARGWNLGKGLPATTPVEEEESRMLAGETEIIALIVEAIVGDAIISASARIAALVVLADGGRGKSVAALLEYPDMQKAIEKILTTKMG